LNTETHITLIGAGNLATQLGIALHDEGYLISQVYSRTKKSASVLAGKINASAITDIKKLNTNSTIYIIAVKDDAIENIAKQLQLKDQIVVHTSGTVSMDVLKQCSKNIGVFYPLQTFSKNKKTDFKNTPICIEANNKATSTTLQYFAKSISTNVQNINSDQRKIIHLAAVFACNFSNHMYAIASEILEKNKLSFDILKPLIGETADKIKNNAPAKMQTGPAIRGDKKTMDAHLILLSDTKQLENIYQILNKSITDLSKNKM
jgi:predicted short-subunit dehydrogenase-like oxidoreductase (DUF2520 family)